MACNFGLDDARSQSHLDDFCPLRGGGRIIPNDAAAVQIFFDSEHVLRITSTDHVKTLADGHVRIIKNRLQIQSVKSKREIASK